MSTVNTDIQYTTLGMLRRQKYYTVSSIGWFVQMTILSFNSSPSKPTQFADIKDAAVPLFVKIAALHAAAAPTKNLQKI